jgi:hypothetical protein
MREQPAKKWFNEPRGVYIRFGIGGSHEDQGHPREGHQPISDERNSFGHRDRKQIYGGAAK